jgi:hypothetical protein
MNVKRVVELLRWPEDPATGLVPWFVIVWRAAWMPLIFCGLAISWVGVLMANGYSQAKYFWRNAT